MTPDTLVAIAACTTILLILLKKLWRHYVSSRQTIRQEAGKRPEITFQEFLAQYYYPRHVREPYGAMDGLMQILKEGLLGISRALSSDMAVTVLLLSVGVDALVSVVITANYLFGDGLTFGETIKVFASTMLSIPLAILVLFSTVWFVAMVWNMYCGITNVGQAKSEYRQYVGRGNGNLIVLFYWIKAVTVCGAVGLFGLVILGTLWRLVGILSPIFSYFNDTY